MMVSHVPTSSSADAIRAAIDAVKSNFAALSHDIAPPWVDGPEFRGTLSILVSCLATLLACVYTALHLNAPMKRGHWAALASKLKWLALSILFPEIAVYSAIRQYSMARALVDELSRLQQESASADKNFKFDITYGFFILLGGVAVSVKDIVPTRHEREQMMEGGPLPAPLQEPCLHDGDSDAWKLKPEGVLELAKKGHFLYISRDTIEDKSKSSAIQKTLVLAQVGWFVTQCIARKAYGLPISLLELHTLVHVACAAIMYAMWWKKPHDVTVPEQVDQRAFEDLVALMVQESTLPLVKTTVDGKSRGPSHDHNETLVLYADPQSAMQVHIPLGGGHEGGYCSRFRDERRQLVPAIAFDRAKSSWLGPGEVMDCGIGLGLSHRHMQVTAKDLVRFERVVRAVHRLDPEPAEFPHAHLYSMLHIRLHHETFRNAFGRDTGNFADSDAQSYEAPSDTAAGNGSGPGRALRNYFPKGDWWFLLVQVLAMANGGIHLAAWSFQFPSTIESILWKVSSFIPAGVIPAYVVVVGSAVFLANLMPRLGGYMGGVAMSVGSLLFFVGALGRVYLVVESFISLRSVPIGVYWTPSWLQMIPHL